MKLPNWFKITWWVVLLIISGTILLQRYSDITTGRSVLVDAFIFLVFVALMLLPIFSEIEFFGIKLKKGIDELKDEIRIKFGDIQNEIRNNQTQTLNATFQGFGPPPPDNTLPELEAKIVRILKTKLAEHGLSEGPPIEAGVEVPDNNIQMFKVRYSIETELRKIWERRFEIADLDDNKRHTPITKILQDLLAYEMIDRNFYGILREILSICNYGIHGENISDKQVAFVTKNAKQVIDYLNSQKLSLYL